MNATGSVNVQATTEEKAMAYDMLVAIGYVDTSKSRQALRIAHKTLQPKNLNRKKCKQLEA